MIVAKEIALLIWQIYKKLPHRVSVHFLLWVLVLGLSEVLFQNQLNIAYIFVLLPSMALLSLLFFTHVFLNLGSSIAESALSIPVINLRVKLLVVGLICVTSFILNQSMESIVVEPTGVLSNRDYVLALLIVGGANSIVNIAAGAYCLSYFISNSLIKPDYKFLARYILPVIILNFSLVLVTAVFLCLLDGFYLNLITLIPSVFSTLVLGAAYAHYRGHKPSRAEESVPCDKLSMSF